MNIRKHCLMCGRLMKFNGITDTLKGTITEWYSCICGHKTRKVIVIEED